MLHARLPRDYRRRGSQWDRWQRDHAERLVEADALLSLVCDCFRFAPDRRFCFAPDDRVTDIYRACYPKWKFWQLGDNLELESLLMELERQFGLKSDEALRWTLGQLVERIADRSKPEWESTE